MMKRLFNIVKSRFKDLSYKEFFELVKSSLFSIDIIFIYGTDISRNKKQLSKTSNTIDIKRGSLNELEKAIINFKSVPWEFRCHLYDGVDDFFIAGENGSIQHISWIYYSSHPNRILRLGPKDAEIKYCLTLPDFRGRCIYPSVLINIVQYLFQKGFRRVFICTKKDNRASIRGIEKAGLDVIGKTRLIKLFGFQVSNRFSP